MLPMPESSPKRIFTIGHSTQTQDVFISILQAYGITLVIDVRTIPRSRHNPQFNCDTLPHILLAAGIGYIHMAGLGGLRHPRPDSTNTGWENSSFRGYADYMETQEFEKNLTKLIDLARKNQIVILCAEAVPWRCHRSLIADALLAREIPVEHILSKTNCKTHLLTPWAKVDGTHLKYP